MKKPDNIREWMAFAFTIVGIIATGCLAYQSLIDRVKTTEKEIAEMKPEVRMLRESSIKMQKDITYIADGVDDLKWAVGIPAKRQGEPNR